MVVGKGRCETWLPLPQDAGDAVLHYLEYSRPRIDDEHVFLRVYAPIGPLASSGPISKLVRRAIERAGIEAPSMGARGQHMSRAGLGRGRNPVCGRCLNMHELDEHTGTQYNALTHLLMTVRNE